MSDQLHTIRGYVEDTVKLCRELAPDLCFGEADDQYRIVFDGLDIEARYIRLGLTEPGILHPRWIEVYAQRDSRILNVAPEGSLSVSSSKPNREALVSRGRFLRPHGGAYGFHTKREDAPWACVDLGTSMALRRIVLVNRNDQWASRAAKLRIETSNDGADWQQIYHHGEAQLELLAILGRRRKHCDRGPDLPLRRMIDQVIVHILSADYDGANTLLRSTPGYGRETKNLVAHALTEHVLAAREFEWTNHSVKRTFRYWSEEQKQNYLHFANRLVEEIIGLGHDSCFGYGGVLSIVRDHDLIPHDDDLDIIVSLPRQRYATLSDGLEDLCGKLEKQGYKASGDYASHRHVSDGRSRAVDLFVGFEEGEFVSWFPGPRRSLLKVDVFPAIRCPLLGVQCLLPRNPFRYVEAVYGPEWMVPISRWNHTWDVTVFSDWFEEQQKRIAAGAQ